MSIIVKSFQKYASVPDFLLKFQTEVRDRLSETLAVDPSATVAETVMRYFSAQFWPRPEASVYINLPEIQIVNPDEQKSSRQLDNIFKFRIVQTIKTLAHFVTRK